MKHYRNIILAVALISLFSFNAKAGYASQSMPAIGSNICGQFQYTSETGGWASYVAPSSTANDNSTGAGAVQQSCSMTTGNDEPAPVLRADSYEIEFAGYVWCVRSSSVPEDPGHNMWSNSNDSVWVDTDGRLHLTIRKIGSTWYSSEVELEQSLGFGRYVFLTESNMDDYDTNIVPAMFLYKNDSSELDIEYGTWSGETVDNVLFTAQPGTPGSFSSSKISSDNGNYLSNVIDWNPDRVVYQVIDGHTEYPRQNNLEYQWIYSGPHNPQTTNGQVAIINFWLYNGAAPTNGRDAEFIVSDFDFIPYKAY